MKKNIITISRQFGSGGRSIGKMLVERLGIPFYDKELIELASKESGIDERIFRSEGEETGRFYQVLGAIGYALGPRPAGSTNIRSTISFSGTVKHHRAACEQGPLHPRRPLCGLCAGGSRGCAEHLSLRGYG